MGFWTTLKELTNINVPVMLFNQKQNIMHIYGASTIKYSTFTNAIVFRKVL